MLCWEQQFSALLVKKMEVRWIELHNESLLQRAANFNALDHQKPYFTVPPRSAGQTPRAPARLTPLSTRRMEADPGTIEISILDLPPKTERTNTS